MRRAALAAILAFGACLRFWQLTSLPPGYWYDEAHKSLVALEIARGLQAPIYVMDGAGLEAGYFWLLAGWFRLFGPSFFATRALSALLGTSTIPLTAWAVSTLFRASGQRRSEWIALGSAALLSELLWHIHWSRLGLETILVPLFAISLLGVVTWAWQRRAWWAFALAGAALGLSQYTNPGARVLPLQVVLTFLLLASGGWRPKLRFGLALALAALAVYAPLGWHFVQHPESFLGRLAFVSSHARAGGLPFVLDSAWKTLLSLNVRGDLMPRHNLAGRPALDPIASAWMVAGVAALALRSPARRPGLAVAACLGVNLLPMALSDGAPGFGRTLGAAPFLVVLPAVGAAALLERAGPRAWVVALIAVSGIGSAGLNVRDYFVAYPRQPGLFDAFEVGLWTLNRAAMAAGRTGAGYLILDEAGLQHPATRLTRELSGAGVRLVNGQTCLVYPDRTGAETTFAALAQWAEPIQARFPGAQLTDVMHEPEPYQYGALLTVAAGTPSTAGGGVPLAVFGGRFSLLEFDAPTVASPGDSASIHLRWRAGPSSVTPYTVFIHLVTESVPYWGGADAEPCQGWYPTPVWHAGDTVEYNMSLVLPAELPPQRYGLAVGMYDSLTGERLAAASPGSDEPDRATVGMIIVQ